MVWSGSWEIYLPLYINVYWTCKKQIFNLLLLIENRIKCIQFTRYTREIDENKEKKIVDNDIIFFFQRPWLKYLNTHEVPNGKLLAISIISDLTNKNPKFWILPR